MGNHHYEYRPGTNVEAGGDGGYFCVYCGERYEPGKGATYANAR